MARKDRRKGHDQLGPVLSLGPRGSCTHYHPSIEDDLEVVGSVWEGFSSVEEEGDEGELSD